MFDGVICMLGCFDDLMNVGGFCVVFVEIEDVLVDLFGIGDLVVMEIVVFLGIIIVVFWIGLVDVLVLKSWVEECLVCYCQLCEYIYLDVLFCMVIGKINCRVLCCVYCKDC